jgi:hypothetical protein
VRVIYHNLVTLEKIVTDNSIELSADRFAEHPEKVAGFKPSAALSSGVKSVVPAPVSRMNS